MFSRLSADSLHQQDNNANLRESEPLIPDATSISSHPIAVPATCPHVTTDNAPIAQQDNPSAFQHASVCPPTDSRLSSGPTVFPSLIRDGDVVDDLPFTRLSVAHPVESAEEILQIVEAELERSPLLSRRTSLSLGARTNRRNPGTSSGGSSHTTHHSPQLGSSPSGHNHVTSTWRPNDLPGVSGPPTAAPTHAAPTATWRSSVSGGGGGGLSDPTLELLSGGISFHNRGPLLASSGGGVGGTEASSASGAASTLAAAAAATTATARHGTNSEGYALDTDAIIGEVSVRNLANLYKPEETAARGGSEGGGALLSGMTTAAQAAALPSYSVDAIVSAGPGGGGGGGGDGGGGDGGRAVDHSGRGPVRGSASTLVTPHRPSGTLGPASGGYGGGAAGGEKKLGIAGVRTWLKVLPDGSSSIVQLDRQQLGVQYGVQLRDFRVLDPVLGATYPSCLLCREGALIVNLEHIKVIITAQFVLVNHADSDKARPFTEELKRRLQCTSVPGGPTAAILTRSPLLHHPVGPHTKVASSPSLMTATGAGNGSGGNGNGGSGSSAGGSVRGGGGEGAVLPAAHMPAVGGGSRLAATSTQHATEAAPGSAGALGQGPIAQVASAILSLLPTARPPTPSLAWGPQPPTWPPSLGGAGGGTLSGSGQEGGVGGGHVSELFGSMPFELRVLEVVLEQTASLLDAQATELERATRLALDELTARVTPRNLERMRNLKGRMAGLTAKVDTVRGVLEKLLDDDRAMTSLNLTARLQDDTTSTGAGPKATIAASIGAAEAATTLHVHANGVTTEQQLPLPLPSKQQPSLPQQSSYGHDGEQGLEEVAMVEMLLEAYFMQLGHTWQRLQSLASYIDSTEDLINLELDQQRNNLISVDLMVTFASFLLTAMSVIAGLFGMNVTNRMETDYSAFLEICIGSAAAAVALWVCFVYCAIRCGLMNGLSMTWR